MKEFAVHAGTEVGKEVLSHVGSQLSVNAQELVTHQTGTTYEPVVEETLDWSNRLEEGIKNRAFILKNGLDKIIEKADSWSVPAAEFLQKAFLRYCTFITDMPGDPNEGNFKQNFQRITGMSMWRAWGLQRDEKWWKNNPSHNSLRHMGSIFQALVGLGVAPNEVGYYVSWRGTSIASARRPGWMFDMNKFIKWSKSFDPKKAWLLTELSQASQQVCWAVDNRLILKKQENVCQIGGVQ